MIICNPTEDERGVESKAFGHAPYFTLVDMDNGQLDVPSNLESRHSAQHHHRRTRAAVRTRTADQEGNHENWHHNL